MPLDTTVLLRALSKQGGVRGRSGRTRKDMTHLWFASAHQAEALLLVIEEDEFIPTKAAVLLANDAIAMGGLSDLAYFVYNVGGQQSVFDLAKEAWVEREYGRIKWRDCEPCEIKSPIDPDDKTLCLVCGSPVR